jgi:hypothetical protein
LCRTTYGPFETGLVINNQLLQSDLISAALDLFEKSDLQSLSKSFFLLFPFFFMVSTVRGKQRIAFLCLLCTILLTCLYTFSGDRLFITTAVSSHQCHITRSVDQDVIRQHSYLNLNDLNSTKNAQEANQHILILTTLQNDQDYLDNYFEMIDKSTYPNRLISIGLLISDSTDNTLEKVNVTVSQLQNRWRNTFYEIDVFQKDFQLDKKPDDTSLNSKRATLARARNYLLTAAMKEYHSWVVWVDVKLYSYPKSIFTDLIWVDEDVVVPNCLQKRDDGQFWAFDRNNWRESDMSLKKQRDMEQSEVLMEGKGHRE